jgi:hypothetical protein
LAFYLSVMGLLLPQLLLGRPVLYYPLGWYRGWPNKRYNDIGVNRTLAMLCMVDTRDHISCNF